MGLCKSLDVLRILSVSRFLVKNSEKVSNLIKKLLVCIIIVLTKKLTTIYLNIPRLLFLLEALN